MQIGVITNPNSRKNKGRPNRAAELQSIVGDIGEVHSTRSVDDIKPILREFLRKRARYWVADGGDGALHWMLRAGLEVLEEDEFKNSDAALPLTMPTNGGTIDFVANNVGIKGKAEALLRKLRGSIERGARIEEVEVDAMRIEALQVNDDGTEEAFRTFGFAVAAGGVGQRFFSLYYQHEDPNPGTIVKILANALAGIPVAYSPLRRVPGIPAGLRDTARAIFKPTGAEVTMDGMVLPQTEHTGIHIGSMSINLGNVFRFFNKADQPGLMHAIIGHASPAAIAAQLPRMHLGKSLNCRDIVDRPCRTLGLRATGDELLSPIIDGERYDNLREIEFSIGPRVRIPKVVGAPA